jgi:DnaJ like chaperone protein
MFFIGPIFGGFLGLMIGGLIGLPVIGMIVGIFLGSSSRGAYNMHKRGSFWGNDFGSQNRASEAFFESIFSMLGKIATADGNISSHEQRVIHNFMANQLGLNIQSQQAALEYFNNAARDETRTFDYWARNLFNHYSNRPAILELAFNILQQVAAADGTISSQEEKMLQAARSIFQLNQRAGQQNYQSGENQRGQSNYSTTGNLDTAYAHLGCSSSISNDELKKLYRKKVNEFHPDKIEAKGLPAEFTQFAQEKFQEIQDSYEKICKARNIS